MSLPRRGGAMPQACEKTKASNANRSLSAVEILSVDARRIGT
jgi:hypothetical protein